MSAGEQSDERKFDGFGFAFDNRFNRCLQSADYFVRVKSARFALRCRLGFVDYPISHFLLGSQRLNLFYKIYSILCTVKLKNRLDV
jgi:hypothetical protein